MAKYSYSHYSITVADSYSNHSRNLWNATWVVFFFSPSNIGSNGVSGSLNNLESKNEGKQHIFLKLAIESHADAGNSHN